MADESKDNDARCYTPANVNLSLQVSHVTQSLLLPKVSYLPILISLHVRLVLIQLKLTNRIKEPKGVKHSGNSSSI